MSSFDQFARYENRDINDPSEGDLDHVRRVRDKIERRVRKLIEELPAQPGAGTI